MAAFDLQTWYQIQYGSGSGLAIFIVETSVEVGGADTTQTNQQWQILQSPNWTSSNPTYLMRNRVGGPDSYLTVYCNTLSDCFSDTRVAMSQANYNLEQSLFQWELPQVGNSQQTYNLVNVANGTDEALTDSGDGIVRMTNDLNAINNTWVLEPLGTIQNETFLTFPVGFRPPSPDRVPLQTQEEKKILTQPKQTELHRPLYLIKHPVHSIQRSTGNDKRSHRPRRHIRIIPDHRLDSVVLVSPSHRT